MLKKCVNTASLYYWDVIKDQQDSCKTVLNTEKDNDSNKSSNTCFDNLFNTYFIHVTFVSKGSLSKQVDIIKKKQTRQKKCFAYFSAFSWSFLYFFISMRNII